MATGTIQIDVVMPQMGVSVSEGTIIKWLKPKASTIEADEALLEISTDKVDTEVPSPGAGVVAKILVHEGETVEVGTMLAEIAPEGAAPVSEPRRRARAVAEPEPAVEPEPRPSRPRRPRRSAVRAARRRRLRRCGRCRRRAPAAAATATERTFVSPVVARIAAEHGVDAGTVQGTGHGGRVTKKDILAFIESAARPPGSEPAPAEAAPAEAEPRRRRRTRPPSPQPRAEPPPAAPAAPPAAPLHQPARSRRPCRTGEISSR